MHGSDILGSRFSSYVTTLALVVIFRARVVPRLFFKVVHFDSYGCALDVF
jgi:hypothetical protein